MINNTAFNRLHASSDWPDLVDVPAWDYTLGGRGRQLVDDVITSSGAGLMLEIGCFLCASTRRWLAGHPHLKVIGVDPWGDSLVQQVERYIGRPNLTRKYPDIETQQQMLADVTANGPYRTALANVAEFRDRFIPFRGTSPDALSALKDAGIEPDVIYIDCDKKPDDLEACHALWPASYITGDDWHWSRTKGYPMRRIVNSFAEKYGFAVVADQATWILKR